MIQFDEHIFGMGWFNHKLDVDSAGKFSTKPKVNIILSSSPHSNNDSVKHCYNTLQPSIAIYIYNHIYTQNNQTHLLNDTQIPRLASPKQEVIEMTTNKNLKNIFKSTHPNPL